MRTDHGFRVCNFVCLYWAHSCLLRARVCGPTVWALVCREYPCRDPPVCPLMPRLDGIGDKACCIVELVIRVLTAMKFPHIFSMFLVFSSFSSVFLMFPSLFFMFLDFSSFFFIFDLFFFSFLFFIFPSFFVFYLVSLSFFHFFIFLFSICSSFLLHFSSFFLFISFFFLKFSSCFIFLHVIFHFSFHFSLFSFFSCFLLFHLVFLCFLFPVVRADAKTCKKSSRIFILLDRWPRSLQNHTCCCLVLPEQWPMCSHRHLRFSATSNVATEQESHRSNQHRAHQRIQCSHQINIRSIRPSRQACTGMPAELTRSYQKAPFRICFINDNEVDATQTFDAGVGCSRSCARLHVLRVLLCVIVHCDGVLRCRVVVLSCCRNAALSRNVRAPLAPCLVARNRPAKSVTWRRDGHQDGSVRRFSHTGFPREKNPQGSRTPLDPFHKHSSIQFATAFV